jgi:hypothetical protein
VGIAFGMATTVLGRWYDAARRAGTMLRQSMSAIAKIGTPLKRSSDEIGACEHLGFHLVGRCWQHTKNIPFRYSATEKTVLSFEERQAVPRRRYHAR